jgi:dihydrofolate reductase/thymidylate synthase
MFDIILACTSDYGIGLNGKLPWFCPEELGLFRKKTIDSTIIVGRKTLEKLPTLIRRNIICVTRSKHITPKSFTNLCSVENSLESALELAKRSNSKIFVIGGADIFQQCLTRFRHDIDRIHISFIKGTYNCDSYVSFNPNEWLAESCTKYENFTHYVFTHGTTNEKAYLELLNDVRQNGDERQGRNGITRSVFVRHLHFDLRKGFPLLTTKKMFMRGIVEELLFFLRGETNSKLLEEKGVNIWKGNTDRKFLDENGMEKRREGIMGPLYGFQWRFFGAEYDEATGKPRGPGIDQLKYVVETIKNDPHSRRILLTDYNVSQVFQGVLFPCHSIIVQFWVCNGRLDMFCYNRSQDLFLGTPFNIASSSLLLTLIAQLCSLTPGILYMTLGDCHVYKEHYDAVDQQVSRFCYKFPKLTINKSITVIENLETLTPENFIVEDYHSHASIKAQMIA